MLFPPKTGTVAQPSQCSTAHREVDVRGWGQDVRDEMAKRKTEVAVRWRKRWTDE